MKVIPNPFNGGGTSEYFNFSLIAASATMAKYQPIPEEKPKTVASAKVYSLGTINNEDPRIAQFTAISGKNIPNDPYNAGENFSIVISTN